MIEISKELGYVYFTSTGEIYAKRIDAEKRQAEINYTKESREIIERRLLVDAEEILAILNERGWGVYYKTNPIHVLGVQGGEPPIFSVNAVSDDIFLNVLAGNDKGDDKWHSETDSTQ
jgi:hypothetical protein|tara:strand:+ start:429 stop:782 length:354 start_codon:yes stop_codon:yes gene_type:complete